MAAAPGAAPGVPQAESEIVEVLTHGDIEVKGRLVDASNATLYATADWNGVQLTCVYKPVAGEQPLHDFARSSLSRREAAAYVLSRAAGWDVVPPTVFRPGPFGDGSVQCWVDSAPAAGDRTSAGDQTSAGDRTSASDQAFAGPVYVEPGAGVIDVVPAGTRPDGWLHVLEAYGGDGEPVELVHADDPALRVLALFDAVANNADRKGGHVLRGTLRPGGRPALFGIDHGLTFHTDDKLRTVLWGWTDAALTPAEVQVLERLVDDLADGPSGEVLAPLLTDAEIRRTTRRAQRLAATARFPGPVPGGPVIPWPPF